MIARRSFGASPRWSMLKAPFNACLGQPPRNCGHRPPSATIGRTGRRCPPGRLRPRPRPSNPKGILSHSPRLAHQRLPWVIIPQTSSTPTGLRPCVTPFFWPRLHHLAPPKTPPNSQLAWHRTPAPAARHHCRKPNQIIIFSPIRAGISRATRKPLLLLDRLPHSGVSH